MLSHKTEVEGDGNMKAEGADSHQKLEKARNTFSLKPWGRIWPVTW